MVDREEDSPMVDESGPATHTMIQVDQLYQPDAQDEERKYAMQQAEEEESETIGPKYMLIDQATG